MISLLANNLDAVVVVIGAVAVAWAAYSIAGAIAALETATLAGAFGALTAAMLANPIGLIAIALVALVAGLIIAYKKCAAFRRIVDAVWAAVKKAAVAVGKVLVGAFKVLWTIVKNTPLLLIIRNLGKIVNFIKGMPGKIASAASGMWDGIKNAFKSAINWIINGWNNLEFSLPKISMPARCPTSPGSPSARRTSRPWPAAGRHSPAGRTSSGSKGPSCSSPA